MSKDQMLNYAKAAFEVTKMVAVIAANTTVKLINVGREEISRQYAAYQAQATKEQKEAIALLTSAATKGKAALEAKVAGATADAKKKLETEKKAINMEVKKKLKDVSGDKKDKK